MNRSHSHTVASFFLLTNILPVNVLLKSPNKTHDDDLLSVVEPLLSAVCGFLVWGPRFVRQLKI